MLGPTRQPPRLGASARVVHFGGGVEPCRIVSVSEHGRRLRVRCDGGEELDFVLSPATARFVAAHGTHGPRLELLAPGA